MPPKESSSIETACTNSCYHTVLDNTLLLPPTDFLEIFHWAPDQQLHNEPPDSETHSIAIASLHTSYPLTKHSTETAGGEDSWDLTINIVPTSYPTEDDINNTDKAEAENNGFNNSLQAHLRFVKRGGKLNDGVIGVQADCVVAIQPERANAQPWFAKVVKVDESNNMLHINYMHRHKNSTMYFYIQEAEDTTHYDTIICNRIDFEPVFKEKLMWKLLTSLPFIQALNSNKPPTMTLYKGKQHIQESQPKYELSNLVFANQEEFKEFVTKLK